MMVTRRKLPEKDVFFTHDQKGYQAPLADKYQVAKAISAHYIRKQIRFF